MCGIAGAVGEIAADVSAVRRQLLTIEHRGPDSWGIHTAPGAACGQTRLAVIDISGSDPPITDESGKVGVAFNGEIYNYRHLRRSLLRQGHRFGTEGDTEVIAHLAETLEPVDVASALDGMFSFAVWDEARRRLLLGRDRMGKKPLYYWTDRATLVFGSEIKAVLAHPSVPRQLEPGAIHAYLGRGYVPTPRTFFDGILAVPPGHVLVFTPGMQVELLRYWDPQIPGTSQTSELDVTLCEAAEQARALLSAAVQRRLLADVPLGAFLSGGVDSSAIVALMAESAAGRPVQTFTIGFEDGSGLDERPYAKQVARHCGTDHFEFVVKPDALELVERLVWHHDQPFGDSSAIPMFLLSELTRNHVTVALCGDGGDEIFAGYERFAAALAVDRYQRLPRRLRGMARSAAARVPSSAFASRARSLQRFFAEAEKPADLALQAWVSPVSDAWRDAFLPEPTDNAGAAHDNAWASSEGGKLLPRLLDLNLRTYLLDDLLPKADRMSMAHGLEVRSPFLDTGLVEFALRLPPRLQLRGFSRKRVLKSAVRDLLPPAILRRRKRGFAVPVDRWFRSDLAAFVTDRLTNPHARLRRHLRPAAIDSMLAEHASGTNNHGHALWTLLTLELFLRTEDW
ncbi:MAG: asparagine synthase (glutamine-hydrolyzing) [Actinomycetota bacterium]|nr:asparagine synthase (glutamine-hydrolyzing) [Actinomycetota bacterium]